MELERFWSKVDKSPGLGIGDCWLWKASKKGQEYGYFKFNGKGMFAHRYAWQEHTGEILKSEDNICHKCDQPLCCKYSHMFKSNHLGNMADRAAKERQPKGNDHWEAILTEDQVRFAYKQRLEGVSISKMAKTLGVAYSTLYDALTGRNWKHLKLGVDK